MLPTVTSKPFHDAPSRFIHRFPHFCSNFPVTSIHIDWSRALLGRRKKAHERWTWRQKKKERSRATRPKNIRQRHPSNLKGLSAPVKGLQWLISYKDVAETMIMWAVGGRQALINRIKSKMAKNFEAKTPRTKRTRTKKNSLDNHEKTWDVSVQAVCYANQQCWEARRGKKTIQMRNIA